MSINNFVPQFASNPLTGQLFMLTPPNQPIIFHNRFNNQFPLQQQQPQAQQQRQQQQPQQNLQHLVPQQPSLRTSYVHQLQQPTFALAHSVRSFYTTQPFNNSTLAEQAVSKTVHKTNLEIRKIKEKCITHYIDGQIIVETAKPLTEKKKKNYKKCLWNQVKSQPQECISHNSSEQQVITKLQQSEGEQTQFLLKRNNQTDCHDNDLKHNQTTFMPTVRSQQVDSEKIQRVRMSMTNWSVSDVVNFIESHESIRQYSAKFAEDEVDGKALLLMIDRNLNLQTLTSMFKCGPAMKIESALSRYKINQ